MFKTLLSYITNKGFMLKFKIPFRKPKKTWKQKQKEK